MNLAKKIIFVSVGFFGLLVFAEAISAKMRAQTMVTANEAVAYYKSTQKKRSLTPEETETYQFILVARDVLKIDSFVVDGYYNEAGKEKALKSLSVARSVEDSIKQNKSWDEPTSSTDLAKLNTVAELLKTNLGADSLSVAWLNYKNGNKSESKAILNRGFDRAYDEGMKIEVIGLSEDSNPFLTADAFSKALTPLSSESENNERASRLKKLNIRASNLPQIMT